MYIHVFNNHHIVRSRYCDASTPLVEIKSVDDGDGNVVISVVPVDCSVPVLCSDVDLKAKLSCGASLTPVAPIQSHVLNVADSASTFLSKNIE